MKTLYLNKPVEDILVTLEPYNLRSVTLRSILLTINDMCHSVTEKWTYEKIRSLRSVTILKRGEERHKISKVLRDIGVLENVTLAVSPSGLYAYESSVTLQES